MALPAGTRLGPYEILAPLGAGGMGEVYRAQDPRLGREVALKVLPRALAQDEERLHRFELEALAAGRLNHPNIVAIYDVGRHEGLPYLVSELLEGGTLRERLAQGPMALRKALEMAAQIAHGLAAAHEAGIVHRDLKPENVALTRDGRPKIVDFGLVKLLPPGPGSAPSAVHPDNPTAELTPISGSEPGRVLGTLGYMSPEQVRGLPVDHRTDIFSLGAILYEMVSGRRAFRGDSAADTMAAVLKEEPPDPSATGLFVPPAIEQLVRHCLEKRPEERYQSARDLAFHLQELQAAAATSSTLGGPRLAGRRLLRRVLRPALIAAAVVSALAVGVALGRRLSPQPPSFTRLTFRRGAITGARFTPDGSTIVYGAAFDGRPFEVYSTLAGGPESRPLGLLGASLLSLSPQGELALSLGHRFRGGHQFSGTLARAPLSGGAPREVVEDVYEAEWLPDGSGLVVVRSQGGRDRLELTSGELLFETAGWISHPRASPGGDRIAFIDHPQWPQDGGSLVLVDRKGTRQVLSSGWLSARGLAWAPGARRLYLTASRIGRSRALWAVDLSGRERLLSGAPGSLTIQDAARDGRILLTRDAVRYEIAGLAPGAEAERDLSWLDGSMVEDISDDGRRMLFYEGAEAGGASPGVYLRGTDGSPPVRLGEGHAGELSPDGRWAIAIQGGAPPRVMLLPTGPGQARAVSTSGLHDVLWAFWMPKGDAVVVNGAQAGRPLRAWRVELAGGGPRPIAPEGFWGRLITGDGRTLVATSAGRPLSLIDLPDGSPREVRGSRAGDRPARLSPDGRLLEVFRRDEIPCAIYRLDLRTGSRQVWKRLLPADSAGVVAVHELQITADGRAYTYGYVRLLSELYLVAGIRP